VSSFLERQVEVNNSLMLKQDAKTVRKKEANFHKVELVEFMECTFQPNIGENKFESSIPVHKRLYGYH